MAREPVVSRTRVLRLFSRLNVGGPAVHVILLTAGLRERGYETRLVVGQEAEREGNLLDLAESKGVRCLRLDALGREIHPLSDVRALAQLYALIREYKPDIVHTHTAKAGLLGRVAAQMARVPVVVHTYHGHVLRGYFGPVKSALFRRLETALAPASDALIAVSDAVRDDLVELGVASNGKIRVIPLGLEIERLTGALPRGVLRRDAGFPADAPLVGIVGRLVPIKNVSSFLAAAEQVARVVPAVCFSVVGDGEERAALEMEAARRGLTGRVHFHGWRRDMEAVYGDLDVVVNCSRNEGTPVALIEALAAGRPVVATRVGGNSDVLADGAHGRLVPAGESLALAGAIVETLQSPHEAQRRARAGQAHVLSRHGIARLLDDVDSLYRELIAAHHAVTV